MKIGDYVRTRRGEIFKFSQTMTTNKEANEFGYDGQYTYIDKKEIIKSSPNIIDLIEVGDYVNGYKVTTIALDRGKRIGVVVDNDLIGFDADEIKSIVTKEQFESVEYKL